MPELPEVETVRRGLERFVVGRTLAEVEVHHPRAIRRHAPGVEDFTALLLGRRVEAARRRGKYLWLPLDSGDALVGHLGMSGQLLAVAADATPEKHLRVRLSFTDHGPDLRFVDQRTFGGLAVALGGAALPDSLAHIALDPVDPAFGDEAFVAKVRARHSEVKRTLLDQTVVSGVGNIYADEALWRAQLHYLRATDTLTRPQVRRLLAAVREVLHDAIAAGGTSFDAMYVNVNGESGWFDRSLDAYGRVGKPCRRCGTLIRRAAWTNRSSFWCPRCQPAPRARRA